MKMKEALKKWRGFLTESAEKGKKFEIKYCKKKGEKKYTGAPGNCDKPYDYLVVVVLDEETDIPIEIHKIPKEDFENDKNIYWSGKYGGSFRIKEFKDRYPDKYLEWPKQ